MEQIKLSDISEGHNDEEYISNDYLTISSEIISFDEEKGFTDNKVIFRRIPDCKTFSYDYCQMGYHGNDILDQIAIEIDLGELLIKQGYRAEIISWENDGDLYVTKYLDGLTKKEARFIYKLCTELFCRTKRVGNSYDSSANQIIIDYVNDNLKLFSHVEFAKDQDYDYERDEAIISYISELAFEYMGSSDFYDFRVCESVKIYCIEEDVYAKRVDF